jgi:nicotinamide-nucleotide amidase
MNEIDTLVAQLKSALTERHLKLAVAESLTCGNLQAALGSVSGASEFFEGGITVYSLKQKINWLNLEENQVLAVNGVSVGVAEQMAKAVCQKFAVDLSLSTTGYAEACPAQQIEQPIAFIAVCHQQVNAHGQARPQNAKGKRGYQLLQGLASMVTKKLKQRSGQFTLM